MQQILKTDPYYVDKASDAGRLFLVRTRGSLSGGTPVKVVAYHPAFEGVLTVAGKVRERTFTAPGYKTVDAEVEVTLEDLVIRKMHNHPDVMEGGNGTPTKRKKNRAERRTEEKVTQAALEQVKAKYAK